MSYSISTLLTRNLHDVFGEDDPARRRAAIDEIFTEDCVFYDPSKSVYRGRDEIDRIAGAIRATHPDFRYQPIAAPEELGNGGRVQWLSGRPGEAPAYAGTDFIISRDGRIAALLSLFRQATMKISRRDLFAAGGSTAMIAMGGLGQAQSAASQTSLDLSMTPDTLGAKAREAMIDIFRKKDPTAVDRYFAESFIQHDPNITDGFAGMKSFAADVASSPAADITIYRTLVDEDFVLLHSRYNGVGRYGAPVIAFDLFRFKGGKIVEHWGGQEPETPPNLSGRTQVDGPTEVLDREKTEANRTLVRTYRETVMVSLRFDRIEEFIEGAHYAQHASKIGDGIARLRDRIASVAKEGGQLFLTPRRFVAEGNFVLVLTDGELPSGPTALYDLFRIENGKIVEHWDVLTPIPPRNQWKNSNGPF